jgi:class 3 adenylate cyclase
LGYLGAAALSATTFIALSATSFQPFWGTIAFAAGAGMLSLAATDLGVLAVLIALSLPLTAANPLVGIVFLVLGVASLRYLGSDRGAVMLLLAAALIGAHVGPVWVAVALAGYVLGASEGALAAALACTLVEVTGLLLGRSALAGTFTGGSEMSALLDFSDSAVPATLFSIEWLTNAFSGFSGATIDRFTGALTAADQPFILFAQPAVWAAGAIVAGAGAKALRRRNKRSLGPVAAAAGALVPAAGAAVLLPAGTAGPGTPGLLVAALSSAIVAATFAAVLERFFPLEVVLDGTVSSPTSMSAEDADVDELLRLISTAEERLATDHTTQKVVMITDMKAFSKMTEEDGSVVTAKAIQKHRDLLLPIVEKRGGHGKSTGGDGLVAAFESPSEAVLAAAEMQRTLESYNESHPDERDLSVRIGIADGEVVLDKGGRPFIGAALNLAARVMNLADGGQAFMTNEIARKAAGAMETASHGDFEMKNIAKPVEVIEILWYAGQEPVDPRTREA